MRLARPATQRPVKFARSISISGATSAAMIASLLAGCTVYQAPPPPQRVYVQAAPMPAPQPVYVEPVVAPVVSVYIEPPVMQPPPVYVGWAPPPMLVETVAPSPFVGAVWTGGYWVWEGNWVWAAGRWAPPPQPNYAWVHPYYENRDGGVVFITGHWSPPGVVFVPPPLGLQLTLAAVAVGVVAGPRPIGPPGVFVPPPPGSRMGLIVPAPIGTAPAVVTSAAPVVNVGMRIQSTRINNVTNVSNVTNVTNVSNVTIVAPASATANGKAFESAVPAQAHLAAALPPVVHANAPTPASARPIPAYVAGRAPAALPPPQAVRMAATPPAATARPAPVAAMPSPQQQPQAQAQAPAATRPAAAAPVPSSQAQAQAQQNAPGAQQPLTKGAAAAAPRDELHARADQDRKAKVPTAHAAKPPHEKKHEEGEHAHHEKKAE